jgi:hypothetical protein
MPTKTTPDVQEEQEARYKHKASNTHAQTHRHRKADKNHVAQLNNQVVDKNARNSHSERSEVPRSVPNTADVDVPKKTEEMVEPPLEEKASEDNEKGIFTLVFQNTYGLGQILSILTRMDGYTCNRVIDRILECCPPLLKYANNFHQY